MSDYFEARKAERKPVCLQAVYALKGIIASCEILDISSTGLKMRVKGLLYKGDQVDIKIENQLFLSEVINVEGNIIGVKFKQLSDIQLNFLLKMKEF